MSRIGAVCCIISLNILSGSHFPGYFCGGGDEKKEGNRAEARKVAVRGLLGTSLQKHSLPSASTCLQSHNFHPPAPLLFLRKVLTFHYPTTLDLGLDDVLEIMGQAPEAEPCLPPTVRVHPLPRPVATGSPGPRVQPKGAEWGCLLPPSQSRPAPARCPSRGHRPRALDPAPQPH